jgi:hypothetical protein
MVLSKRLLDKFDSCLVLDESECSRVASDARIRAKRCDLATRESRLVAAITRTLPATQRLCGKYLKNEAFYRKKGQIDD